MTEYLQPFVFLSGAYGDKDGYLVIEERIQRARSAAAECAKRGIPYYSPHLNSAHFEAVVPEVGPDFWLRQDSAFLPRAAAVLVIAHGWVTSPGTRAEVKQAAELGLPIFFFPASVEHTLNLPPLSFLDMVEWWTESEK